MYRLIFRTVLAVRQSSAGVWESCVLSVKCDKAAAPGLRVAHLSGVKSLSTSSVRLCENKKDVVSSEQNEKTHADKEVEVAETPMVAKQAEGDTEQQRVKTEQVTQTAPAKSGKAGLLELLGTMKVDITTKRKINQVKDQVDTSKPEAGESTTSMFQQAQAGDSSESVTLEPELVAAASAAATTLPDSRKAESELLRQLRQRKAVAEARKKGDTNYLGEIITDMKVGIDPPREKLQTIFTQANKRDRGAIAANGSGRKKSNIFAGKRLGIFTPPTGKGEIEPTAGRPTLWDIEYACELSATLNTMPRNGIEEMIQWTKEGKMWQYPINNEAGLEEEASVPFHEHVFLEKHLEEGFPRQGPVRHFMELVVNGLSKNPYLTVQQKKEHISWFRDYFQQKEEVLKESEGHL